MREIFALIPVKHPARGKSRLAHLLDPSSRRSLNLVLAQHTLEVCLECVGAQRTVLVSPSPLIRELARSHGAHFVHEGARARGLNPALRSAANFAVHAGAKAIAVVPTDIPLLSRQLLQAALQALPEAPGCLLVPDRHGTGTNLLCMSPARPEIFSFGKSSLQRHARGAELRGFEVCIHRCTSLGMDLDLPEDVNHLEATKAWPTFASITLKPSANPSDSIRT
jgi:2-phospho-L-lactate guanylyltransferase